MRTSQMFPSKYCKADDFFDGPQIAIIRDITMETLGRGKDEETKPVIHFENDNPKPLVPNVTNTRTIEDAFGFETDDWAGCQIELYAPKVPFGSKIVDGIRIRIPKEPDAGELIGGGDQGGSGPAGGLGDEIPFAPLRELP